jgi:Tfp pilus assembly PilM family ATPase
LARFLSLDWDNNQLHLVAASAGRGGVRVERAVVWQDDFSPAPGKAEAVGQRLREYLRGAGIAAAPALVCVGRERTILKEVRHPAVPAAEEPAVVRFQASKELTEAGDNMVLDYAAKGPAAPSGEKVAFAFAVRRDVVLFLQAACRAAGLKLLTITPRGYGVAACLKRSAGTAITTAPDAPEAVEAVLTVAGAWADFSVVRGDQLLYTRSVAAGGPLVAEVRRNLAVYGGQASSARDRVQAVHVAAGAAHAGLVEQLRNVLSIPVHTLDPFARDATLSPPEDAGGFTPAVGLLVLWGASRKAPVNFVQPKEPVKQSDPQTQKTVKVAALAGAGLLAVVLLCWAVLNSYASRLEELRYDKARYDSQLLALTPDAKHIEALKEWDGKRVSWLNELYDVTAHFPYREGFRLTEFTGLPRQQMARGPGQAKAKNEEKYTGQLSLFGELRPNEERSVDELNRQLTDAKHRSMLDWIRASGNTKSNNKTFLIRVDVAHQEPKSYTSRFTPPPQSAAPSGGRRPARPGSGDDFEEGLE